MEMAEMDQYLDFCESGFVRETSEFESIEHMFRERAEAHQDSREAVEGGSAKYDSDDGADYTAWSMLVVESAARVTGWGGEDVAGSVERVERQLGRWWKRRKDRADEPVFVV